MEEPCLLDYCEVDLSNEIVVDPNFIVRIRDPKSDRELNLHGPHGNPATDIVECWREVLAITQDSFEENTVRLRDEIEGMWTMLGFHDKAILVPSNPRDDRVLAVQDTGSQITEMNRDGALSLLCSSTSTKTLHCTKTLECNKSTRDLEISSDDPDQYYALKHYLEKLGKSRAELDPEFSINLAPEKDGNLSAAETIERKMKHENKAEELYERNLEYFLCTRSSEKQLGDTFFHRAIPSGGHGRMMKGLGYGGFASEGSSISSGNDIKKTARFPMPHVSFLHEWFWPHITYESAQEMLNERNENFVLVRMSQSKPGHFAMTAACGERDKKMFRHFFIKTVGEGKYKFGRKIFTSFVEVINHFVEIHQFKYIPYAAKRTEKWRTTMNCLRDIRKARFNQQSISDSRDSATDSTVPAKPPRRRSTKPKTPRDKFARAVNSMANLDMPVLLTIQDSD